MKFDKYSCQIIIAFVKSFSVKFVCLGDQFRNKCQGFAIEQNIYIVHVNKSQNSSCTLLLQPESACAANMTE